MHTKVVQYLLDDLSACTRHLLDVAGRVEHSMEGSTGPVSSPNLDIPTTKILVSLLRAISNALSWASPSVSGSGGDELKSVVPSALLSHSLQGLILLCVNVFDKVCCDKILNVQEEWFLNAFLFIYTLPWVQRH